MAVKKIQVDGIETDQETIDRFNMMMALGLEGEIFGYYSSVPEKPRWLQNFLDKQDEGDRFPRDYEGGKDE